MSSESITKNDLKEILNGIFPAKYPASLISATDASGADSDVQTVLNEKEPALTVIDDYIGGIGANTYYYNGTRSVAKTGYVPVCIVGYQLNQAGLHLYKLKLNGTNMEYGIALNQNSGTMASVRLDFQVLYRKA